MTTSSELTKAVAAVMKDVKRIAKDDKNQHGGYKYTSIDDIKDSLRPMLAKHGLEVRTTEVEYALETLKTKSGDSVSARITFELKLRHESGAEDEPERTTVTLPHTGAQTTGAAKSYAIKEWLKGRFLVSTGETDADADSHAPEDYNGAGRVQTKAPSPTTSMAADSLADHYIKAITSAETREACEEAISKARQAVHRMSNSDKVRLTNIVETRRAFWMQSPIQEAAA